MDKSFKYCPLCGAHELEWHEGEADVETLLDFKEEIHTLELKVADREIKVLETEEVEDVKQDDQQGVCSEE